MSSETASDRRVQQIQALYEQERQREAETGALERFGPGEVFFEVAEEGDPDGHCVNLYNNGGWARQIEVIPGRRIPSW